MGIGTTTLKNSFGMSLFSNAEVPYMHGSVSGLNSISGGVGVYKCNRLFLG